MSEREIPTSNKIVDTQYPCLRCGILCANGRGDDGSTVCLRDPSHGGHESLEEAAPCTFPMPYGGPCMGVRRIHGQGLGEIFTHEFTDAPARDSDDPGAPDAAFPNRPDHSDFRTIAALVRTQDDIADEYDRHDGPDFMDFIAERVDPDSLLYMAAQRVLRLPVSHSVAADAAMKALYLDAFLTGMAFASSKVSEDV